MVPEDVSTAPLVGSLNEPQSTTERNNTLYLGETLNPVQVGLPSSVYLYLSYDCIIMYVGLNYLYTLVLYSSPH